MFLDKLACWLLAPSFSPVSCCDPEEQRGRSLELRAGEAGGPSSINASLSGGRVEVVLLAQRELGEDGSLFGDQRLDSFGGEVHHLL